MSKRTPHIQSFDTYFHIYNRGVNRNTVFFDDENYRFFIQRMSEYLTPELDVIAYCLMPNHFHFLVQQHQPEAISTFMGRISKSYVQAVNMRFNRTGHLFEGKYKINEIDTVQYLVHLSSYIHLNPVRAGLVNEVKDWRFRSYKAYAEKNENEGLVKPNVVLQEFDENNSYSKFVETYQPNNRETVKSFLF